MRSPTTRFACTLSCALAFFLPSAPFVSPSSGLHPHALAVGDFNGDGWLDLAVAILGQRSISILLNDGAGALVEQFPIPLGAEPLCLAVEDLNGDGQADLVVGVSGKLIVLWGQGNGSFQPGGEYGDGLQPAAVTAGDFSGDGNRLLTSHPRQQRKCSLSGRSWT